MPCVRSVGVEQYNNVCSIVDADAIVPRKETIDGTRLPQVSTAEQCPTPGPVAQG